MVKNLPADAGDAGDMDSVPRLRRSPGGGNGNPVQYPCLDSMEKGEPGSLQPMGSHTTE